MSDFVFEERPYQREAVEKALSLFDAGSESVLIESPVGSGKTVMGLMIVQELQRRMPLKVNYVASRKHILDQMSKLNAEFFHCDLTPVSVFSSNPPPADLMILDEAHHEATQSCVNLYERTGNRLTLGLSATPMRTDRMRLSFQHNIHCCNIQRLIDIGVLSPYHAYKMPEWNVDTVSRIFIQQPEHWGKSLVFFSTIGECRVFKARLAEAGLPCEVVTGSSNKDKQLELFINGELPVIANVSVLSEGFDLPELSSVFIRDASRLPTIQMGGRGLRRAPGKECCKIVQSEHTPFPFEKVAQPAEGFRYYRDRWLSCSGDSRIIAETVAQSVQLLEGRREIRMPRYFADAPHKRYVTLRNFGSGSGRRRAVGADFRSLADAVANAARAFMRKR